MATPVKETLVSLSTTSAVSATAMAGVVIVAMIAGRADGPYNMALQPAPFAGDVADVWGDAFAIPDQPQRFLASMRQIAEANARVFKVGKVSITVTTLRADGALPCQPLVTAAGEMPPRWGQALCPLRVRVVDTETGQASTASGLACMPPSGSDLASRTIANVDVHAGLLMLSTTRDGVPEPACERTIHIPPFVVQGG